MRRGLLILLLFPILSYTQPTFHGAIGVPADPGTSATSPVTFNSGAAPLSTMATGDLAIVYLYCRNASATFTYSNTTNTNAVMIIFRPVTSTNSWGLSAASNTTQENTLTSRAAAATFGAPADAGSYTPAQNNNVSLLIVSTDDDNTWGTPSNGFTQITSPSSQFRNTSGSDASSAYSYLIQGTAASQTATGLTQATLGNDPGIAGIYIWYEFTPVSLPRRVSIISKK
jgi:hypothetical protein